MLRTQVVLTGQVVVVNSPTQVTQSLVLNVSSSVDVQTSLIIHNQLVVADLAKLSLSQSASVIVAGDAYFSPTSTLSINSLSGGTIPLSIQGCGELRGTLNLVGIANESAILQCGCCTGGFDTINVIANPSTPSCDKYTPFAKYTTSTLVVAWTIEPRECESRSQTLAFNWISFVLTSFFVIVARS